MSTAVKDQKMQVFQYPEISVPANASPAPSETGASPTLSNEIVAEKLLQAHAEGLREGEQRGRVAAEQSLVQERALIAESLKKFNTEVSDYYSRIEVEVVKLALSIAAKILHREAQVDPLLVAGLVRVALSKFQKNTKALVRVRPEEASGWRQYFAQQMEPSSMPEVLEDPTVALHSCTLETDLGSTELGMEIQLKEIENGLFDLLAQRPQAK